MFSHGYVTRYREIYVHVIVIKKDNCRGNGNKNCVKIFENEQSRQVYPP